MFSILNTKNRDICAFMVELNQFIYENEWEK